MAKEGVDVEQQQRVVLVKNPTHLDRAIAYLRKNIVRIVLALVFLILLTLLFVDYTLVTRLILGLLSVASLPLQLLANIVEAILGFLGRRSAGLIYTYTD